MRVFLMACCKYCSYWDVFGQIWTGGVILYVKLLHNKISYINFVVSREIGLIRNYWHSTFFSLDEQV